MITVYKINWFRVIVDLNRVGWSDSGIAEEINVGKATIAGYKSGRQEPGHTNGEKLLALHRMAVLSPDIPKTEPRLA